MENKEEKKIEELNIDELKSMAYDNIMLIERFQNNLRILQEEIKKRGAVNV